MRMRKYSVKVKHDNGTTTFNVMATDFISAIDIVCKAEGCPRSAIMSSSRSV